MLRWAEATKRAADENPEEPEDWEPPHDIERAWTVWCLLNSTGWKHLPDAGGILDQDEELMSDLATIEWMNSLLKRQGFIKE